MTECELCGEGEANSSLGDDDVCQECLNEVTSSGDGGSSDPLSPLKAHDHWVEWGRSDGNEKRPFSPSTGSWTGHSEDHSGEWAAFEDTWDRRGFVLTGSPFWGIDIDDAVVEDGELVCTKSEDHDCDIDTARKLMMEFGGSSYWERSPSGEGYHMFAELSDSGGLDGWSHKGAHAEVYTTDRYLTVTGDEIDASSGEIEDKPVGMAKAYIHKGADDGGSGAAHGVETGPGHDLSDEELVEKIRGSESGEKFEKLYEEGDTSDYKSHSEADMALANMLAWWTGGDPSQIDSLFKKSALMRGKWNRDDYAKQTIKKALESQDGFYDPNNRTWESVLWHYGNDDVPPQTARHEAAELLREEHDWLTTRDTEELHRYDETKGVWRPDGEQFVHQILVDELGEHFSTHGMKEIVSRLKGRNYVDRDELGADLGEPLVALENGTLDLYSGELREHSPEHRLITHVPVEYDPDAECLEFEDFLDLVLEGDQDKIDTVFEILAASIAPGLPTDNFVIFYGNGRNGKSTLLKCIERFAGEDNSTAESLHRLASDNHARTSLYGARANIAGDLPSNRIKRTGLIKRLSGGDTIMANPKNKTPFEFQNKAEMIFAANDPPEFMDDSTALYRRLVAVEMPVEIPPERQEPMEDVLDRIASDEELSGMLNRAIEAYGRILKQSKMTAQPDSEEQAQIEYERHSNPVRRFVEACASNSSTSQVPKSKVYDAYRSWAVDTGAKKLNKTQLTKRLKSLSGYEIETCRPRMGDERVRCYQGLKLIDEGRHHADIWGERDDGNAELV